MNFKIKRNEKLNVEKHTKYKNKSTDKEKGTCIFDDLCVQTIQFHLHIPNPFFSNYLILQIIYWVKPKIMKKDRCKSTVMTEIFCQICCKLPVSKMLQHH